MCTINNVAKDNSLVKDKPKKKVSESINEERWICHFVENNMNNLFDILDLVCYVSPSHKFWGYDYVFIK